MLVNSSNPEDIKTGPFKSMAKKKYLNGSNLQIEEENWQKRV